MGARSDISDSSPRARGRSRLGRSVAAAAVFVYGAWLVVARPDWYEAGAALFPLALAIAVLVFVVQAVTEKAPKLVPGDEAEIGGRRYVVTGYGLGRKLSGKARWINIAVLAGGFVLLVVLLATGGGGREADLTVLQGVAYLLGLALILGAIAGPDLTALLSRMRRGASSEVVVVSRARPRGEDRKLARMGEQGTEAGRTPAAKWVLIAGRVLLVIGIITSAATDGHLSFPFAVAGVLSAYLAIRWAASRPAWERDYTWMSGLSTGEAALILGFSVGGSAKPMLGLSTGARRAIGVAMAVFVGAVLLLIGIGAQAG